MIRPITIVTFLMASGSGLYLYQSKHEVQVLDRTIEKTVHETAALREQSRLLSTEWQMLNDPERLRQFSDVYLGRLKSIDPKQYTSVADLGERLRKVGADVSVPVDDTPAAVEPVAGGQPEGSGTGVSGGGGVAAPAAAGGPVAGQALPVPPVPMAHVTPGVGSAVRPAEVKVASFRPLVVESQPQPRPAVAAEAKPAVQHAPELRTPEVRVPEVRAFEQHPADQRVVEPHPVPRGVGTRAEVRAVSTLPPRPVLLAAPLAHPAGSPSAGQPAPYRPVPYQPGPYQPAQAAASSGYGGSLLGMAHGSLPPAPRPTPVNATYGN